MQHTHVGSKEVCAMEAPDHLSSEWVTGELSVNLIAMLNVICGQLVSASRSQVLVEVSTCSYNGVTKGIKDLHPIHFPGNAQTTVHAKSTTVTTL